MTEEEVMEWMDRLVKFFAWVGATFCVVTFSAFIIHVLGG